MALDITKNRPSDMEVDGREIVCRPYFKGNNTLTNQNQYFAPICGNSGIGKFLGCRWQSGRF